MRWGLVLPIILSLRAAAGSVLGVDYGTDFVKSSVVAPNAPFEIVLTADSQRKDASGLVIKPDGERIYGSSGTGLVSRFPDASLYALKPLLGLPFDDLQVGLFQEMHPGLSLVPTARNSVAFNVSGVVYPVEEVVAMQLVDVKSRATELVRAKTLSNSARVRDIAISVPGYFGSSQRQALTDAAVLADTDLISLVSDGVAVALNYANSPAVASKLGSKKQYIVVYDAGASAASSALISLRQINDQTVVVEVEGYSSEILLGGRGMTLALRELLFERFTAKTKAERTPRILNRLWREAERAKQVLSANSEVSIHIESLANDVDLDTKVTREQFETLVADQVSQVQQPLKESLGEVSLEEIEAVVLVGGATRTPFVSEKLAELVGEQKISRNVNADEANTQGTSLRGVGLSGIFKSKKKFIVTDRLPHTYHVSLEGAKGTYDYFQVFGDLPKIDSETSVELPQDIRTITLFEDAKKLVSWDLAHVKQTVDALYEPGPYTCVSSSRLLATFGIDANGIVKLKGVDAVCDSVRSETTTPATAASSTDSATSTTAAANDTQSAAVTETTSTSSTSTSSSTSSASVRPKTRRLSSKANWEQAPIGLSERSELLGHLRELNNKDAARQKHSVLHHELESLIYRVRGMVDEVGEEIVHEANKLLAWVEEGAGTIEELTAKLEEARGLYSRASEVADKASDSDSEDNRDHVDHDEL